MTRDRERLRRLRREVDWDDPDLSLRRVVRVFSLRERDRDLWSPRGLGEGERPLREAALARGDEAERRRREERDFSAGSGEDTDGLLRRRGGVRERVSGEDEAERLRRESLALRVSSGEEREPRRRGGERDLVVSSGDSRALLRAALGLGGCSGEEPELLLPSSGEGPLPLLEEPDLLRLGRAREAGALGSGEDSEPLRALGAARGLAFRSGDEPDRLRRGEGRDLPSASGEDPERLLCLSGSLGAALESGEESDSLPSRGDAPAFPSGSWEDSDWLRRPRDARATVFCSPEDSDPLRSRWGPRRSGEDGERLRGLGVCGNVFGSGEDSHSLLPLDGVRGASFAPGEDPD